MVVCPPTTTKLTGCGPNPGILCDLWWQYGFGASPRLPAMVEPQTQSWSLAATRYRSYHCFRWQCKPLRSSWTPVSVWLSNNNMALDLRHLHDLWWWQKHQTSAQILAAIGPETQTWLSAVALCQTSPWHWEAAQGIQNWMHHGPEIPTWTPVADLTLVILMTLRCNSSHKY